MIVLLAVTGINEGLREVGAAVALEAARGKTMLLRYSAEWNAPNKRMINRVAIGTPTCFARPHTFHFADNWLSQDRFRHGIGSVPSSREIPLPEEWRELFLANLLKTMVDAKGLPKYQFERVVGPFVAMFLADIVGTRLRGS